MPCQCIKAFWIHTGLKQPFQIMCVHYSLVPGLWNHVFLFSNLSMFVFLPFAYLFSESSGFPGCRGLKGRVYETFIVLALLGVAMLGLAYVISAWLEGDRSSIDALLSEYALFTYSRIFSGHRIGPCGFLYKFSSEFWAKIKACKCQEPNLFVIKNSLEGKQYIYCGVQLGSCIYQNVQMV